MKAAFIRTLEQLETRIAPAIFIAAAGGGIVKIFANGDIDPDDSYETNTDTFQPFPNYKGPITVAMADLDGDSNAELITAQAAGKDSQVKIWDLTGGGRAGALLESVVPFSGSAIKGVSVAAADLNNDGMDELIVGAGPGGAPTINIYSDIDGDGQTLDNMTDTSAAFPANFKGGVKVAGGNTISSTPGEEIVTAMWRKGGTVSVFSDANANLQISDETNDGLFETFQPLGAKVKTGLNIAAGLIESVSGAGAEIVVGAVAGKPRVLILTDANNDGKVGDDPIFDTLQPAGAGLKTGVALAVGDTDDSGTFVEVLVGPGGGTGGRVKIFDDSNDTGSLLSDDPPSFEFDAIAGLKGGINLAVGKVLDTTFSREGAQVSIPEAGSGSLNSSIFIPASAGTIRDLDINLAIAHTFNGDLDVTLTHVATNTVVTLFTDVGGTDAGFIITLNDEAGTDIGSADNPDDEAISGTFNLEGAALLSIFDGLSAGGEWRLTITDDSPAGPDVGSLITWSMRIRP
jgi:subtilisin-like proprotein convertase family protein